MTAYPIVIIGVGTSGLRIIEQMQRFQYFTSDPNEEDSEVRYVYIETESGTKTNPFPDDEYTQKLIINSNYPIKDYEELKQAGSTVDWVPTAISRGEQSDPIRAGGGMPGFGRFVLRVNLNTVTTGLNNALLAAKASAKRINVRRGNEDKTTKDEKDPMVFITGTLTGGTGTGVFIDVACLVRHLHPQVDPIGLFLLPPNTLTLGKAPDSVAYGNTYGALQSLSLFDIHPPTGSSAEVKAFYKQREDLDKYKEMFPGMGWVSRKVSPFKLVQLLSATDRNGSKMSLTTLYKMAGLYLYLNRKGYLDKWLQKWGDAVRSEGVTQYGTFGLAGVQFPKEDITTYAALTLVQNLMDRWLHPDEYFGTKAQKYIPIGKAEAELGKTFVEELFIDSAERQATVLSTIRQAFDTELKTIFSKVQDKHTSVREYIAKSFGPDTSGNLYEAVGSMVKQMQDGLILRIDQENRRFCNQCESLTLAEKALTKLGERMRDVAVFWRSQGVGNWAQTLELMVKEFPGHPSFAVDPEKRKAIQSERLEGLFTLLMKHHLVERLDAIGKHVQEETVQVEIKADDGTLLPYKGLYAQFRKKFNPVVTKVPVKGQEKINLIHNRGQIWAEVHDPAVPFERVYSASGSGEAGKEGFEREVQRAIATFEQTVLNRGTVKQPCYSYLKIRDHLTAPPADFWDLLTKWEGQVAYEQLSDGYRQLLLQKKCVRDYDVATHLMENVATLTTMAQQAATPLLHLKQDIRLNLKPETSDLADKVEKVKVVIGADELKLSELLKKLEDKGIYEFPDDPDHISGLPDMENFAFFFKQFTGFSPCTELADAATLAQIHKNGSAIGTTPNPDFERKRTAYFPVS